MQKFFQSGSPTAGLESSVALTLGEIRPGRRWGATPLGRTFLPYASHWDYLNRRFMAGHPLLDSRFIHGLVQHFGDGTERLCQLEWDGVVVGLGIFKPADPSKPGVWTTFLPGQAPIAPFIIPDATSVDGLLPSLPGFAWQLDCLCQDTNFSPLFGTCSLPVKRMQHALTINIRLDGEFDAYWAERPKSLRSAMRTRDNRLARAGLQPRLVCISSPEAIPGAVERFGRLETAGWKGRAGTAVAAGNVQGRFYTQVLQAFAQTGQSTVYEYWLGEHLAASELTINHESMVVLLKTTHDEELGEWAPGRLLLREIIRDAYRRFPGGSLEFYTKASANELAWATNQRWIEHVTVYRSQTAAQMSSVLGATRSLRTSLRQRTLTSSN